MKDYDNIDLSSETNDIVEKYQTEHLSELQEIYLSQGEQAMMEKSLEIWQRKFLVL